MVTPSLICCISGLIAAAIGSVAEGGGTRGDAGTKAAMGGVGCTVARGTSVKDKQQGGGRGVRGSEGTAAE